MVLVNQILMSVRQASMTSIVISLLHTEILT